MRGVLPLELSTIQNRERPDAGVNLQRDFFSAQTGATQLNVDHGIRSLPLSVLYPAQAGDLVPSALDLVLELSTIQNR
jgi:hypothetical protein